MHSFQFGRTTLVALVCSAAIAAGASEMDRRPISVPPGDLAVALRTLATQSGVEFFYQTELVKGLHTDGVSGELTPQEAVTKLLRGTPLVFREDESSGALLITTAAKAESSSGGYRKSSYESTSGSQTDAQSDKTTKLEASLETIIVTSEKLPEEYGGGQVARGSRLGLLGNRDIMDTPLSTTGFTSEYIQDVGARGLMQVITSDASVRAAGSESQSYDVFDIRGFTVGTEDVAFDGLYGVAPWDQVAVETVERVELIKGPSTLLGGMSPVGSIGGSVNLAPKRAGVDPLLSLTTMFVSDSQLGAHVDVGRRFGGDQQLGIRVNGVYRDGDGALEGLSKKAEDAAIGIDFDRGGLQLTADFGYQSRDYRGMDSDSYLGVALTTPPRAPSAGKRYLQPWLGTEEHSVYGVARAEYQFGSNVFGYIATGFGRTEGSYVLSYGTSLNNAGDFDENFWGKAFKVAGASSEAGIRVTFTTGGLDHQLALAATRTQVKRDELSFYDGSIDGSAALAVNPSNIYSPNFIPEPNLAGFPRPPKILDTTLSGVSLADTLSMADGKVQLTLGARLQNVKNDEFDPGTGEQISAYDEQALSPSAGVVFRPIKAVSIYANYMEGLARGPTAQSPALNAGQIFEPYRSKQIEAGVKLDRGGFGATFAVFQIARPQGIIDQQTMIYSLDGEQRNRGLEVSIFGEPQPGVRLLGGVMLLDAELTKTEDPANAGRRPDGVSKVNVTLGGDWSLSFLPGLAISARGTYASPFYMSGSAYWGNVEAPSWTRFDLGASYAFDANQHPVTMRLNIENVFDEAYWSSQYFYRGNPRTVVASATVKF
ncbi:TonB-dependent receptor [Steroidobacter sp.]|uniref:TonB-dependent receptor n=1 Tax=Steroidobacter sp. TaxID=1978227 RepID=UPI001A48F19B|nr:TonB-dependent receptor [Steroidobacter sp.]MBL8265618.1 TonB-dependent receptor [Steroidobacter sp.]